MSAFDGADLLEEDFPAVEKATAKPRPSDREELETQVVGLQKRITDLNRELEEVERERATVEDSRRRFSEFETGREEMLHDLTRGLGLLVEAEHDARRDAEQMARTIAELRDALDKVEVLEDIDTNQADWKVHLTRSLTAIENARMEMNRARLKWTLLSAPPEAAEPREGSPATTASLAPPQGLGQLCLWGLALTWPLLLLGLAVFLHHLLSP